MHRLEQPRSRGRPADGRHGDFDELHRAMLEAACRLGDHHRHARSTPSGGSGVDVVMLPMASAALLAHSADSRSGRTPPADHCTPRRATRPGHTTGQKGEQWPTIQGSSGCVRPSPNVIDDAVERRDGGEIEFRSVDSGVKGCAWPSRKAATTARSFSWTTSSNDVDEVAASSPIARIRSSSTARDVADRPSGVMMGPLVNSTRDMVRLDHWRHPMFRPRTPRVPSKDDWTHLRR